MTEMVFHSEYVLNLLGYELDSGEGNWNHFIEFIRVLNSENESFVTEIQKSFDVDRFLRYFDL